MADRAENSVAVTVWRIDLRDARPDLVAVLSPDERAKADRFHFPRDRERYIVAHAALRDILGQAVGAPAERLALDSGPFGKPFLSPHRVDFNLSHTPDLAVVAVAGNCAVGIDVEQIQRATPRVASVERYLSSAEVAGLNRLPIEHRPAALLRIWTCKEAFLKGTGAGLSRPLDSFDVDVDPGRPPELAATRPDLAEAAAWSLHGLALGPDYVGALAVHSTAARIAYRDWTH